MTCVNVFVRACPDGLSTRGSWVRSPPGPPWSKPVVGDMAASCGESTGTWSHTRPVWRGVPAGCGRGTRRVYTVREPCRRPIGVEARSRLRECPGGGAGRRRSIDGSGIRGKEPRAAFSEVGGSGRADGTRVDDDQGGEFDAVARSGRVVAGAVSSR